MSITFFDGCNTARKMDIVEHYAIKRGMKYNSDGVHDTRPSSDTHSFHFQFHWNSKKNGFQSVPPHKNRPVFNSSGPEIILWILSTNHPRKTFLAKVIEIF